MAQCSTCLFLIHDHATRCTPLTHSLCFASLTRSACSHADSLPSKWPSTPQASIPHSCYSLCAVATPAFAGHEPVPDDERSDGGEDADEKRQSTADRQEVVQDLIRGAVFGLRGGRVGGAGRGGGGRGGGGMIRSMMHSDRLFSACVDTLEFSTENQVFDGEFSREN